MRNEGKELQIAALAEIKDGKTFAGATKDLQSSTRRPIRRPRRPVALPPRALG